MKSLLLLTALLIAGCTEQAVEKRQELCVYCGKPYERVRCTQEKDSVNAIPDSTRHYVDSNWCKATVIIYSTHIKTDSVTENCWQLRNFATWCQKAHPEVWREYHYEILNELKKRESEK